MTHNEAGAVSPIYTGVNIQNEFIAFWKPDENTLAFFVPDDWHQKHTRVSLAEWLAIRADYDNRDDFRSYDDITNAAWHFLGQHMNMLKKQSVIISQMQSGKYYRRIWRGRYRKNELSTYNIIDPFHVYGYQFTQSIVAASSLFNYLIDIFRHIEPSTANFNAYGHKSRELLMLACTEIESAWRAVLEENTKCKKCRYTTIDYIKVKAPLQLDKWTVRLTDYPDISPFTPFAGWDNASTTKSIGWYDAYNSVKHDREAEFSKATLGNLLNAMAALHVMQAAQWGPEVYSRFHGNRFSPFDVVKYPEYEPSELYIPCIDGSGRLEPALYFER